MGILAESLDIDSQAKMNSEFSELCLEIRDLAKAIGVDVRPYLGSDLPIFSKLPVEAKESALKNLKIYRDICQSTLVAGSAVSDSKVLIWHAIRAFGLRPTSDLFNFIKDHHVIEIHDGNGIQLFRNFEFYRFSSYSIEELYTVSWHQLFKHEESFFPQVVGLIGRLLSGQINTVVPANIGDYMIEEVSSPGQHKIKSKLEYGAPLFNEAGQPVATIGLEVGELISSIESAKPEFVSADPVESLRLL